MKRLKSDIKLLTIVIGLAFVVLTLALMSKINSIWKKD